MSSGNSADETVRLKLPPEIFLDTSIHVARLKGARLCARVNKNLGQFSWRGSGTYAKLEYGNVVLSAAGYLLNKLHELGSLESLRYFVVNQLSPDYQRHYVMWYGNLLHHHFNKPEATERAERALRHLLRVGTDAVDRLCDRVHDGIACEWANQTLVSGPRGAITRWQSPAWKNRAKRRPPPRCRIDQFFVEKKALFEKMACVISKAPPGEQTEELKTFVSIIEQAAKTPEFLRDCVICAQFADAILAAQSEGYHSFFTQNLYESDVLCRVMQQLLCYLAPDIDKDVERRDYRNYAANDLG
jgi:hypothetical protein